MHCRSHKIRLSNISAITLVTLAVTGCGVGLSEIEPSDTAAVNEQDPDYSNKVSAPASVRPAVNLGADASGDFIDIRGVGDSGWSGLRATQPPSSGMRSTLKAFDPSQKILKGDLSFINWESGVGTRCNAYFNVDFAFMSRPEAIKEAFEHGVHSRKVIARIFMGR